jgi:hypothetical protein
MGMKKHDSEASDSDTKKAIAASSSNTAAAALAYHNEEDKDESDDLFACIFHEWQAAKAEDRQFDLPPAITDEEIEKLGLLVSQVDQPVQPPLPRFATDIMSPDLTEEEALQRALQNSAPQPPPPPSWFSPWAAPPPPPVFNPWADPPPHPQPVAHAFNPWAAPPPPLAAPAYVPPVARYRSSLCSTTRRRSRRRRYMRLLVYIFLFSFIHYLNYVLC